MKQKKNREEKKKIRRGIFAASIVLIVVVLGFMIWCAMEGFAADVFYYVPIGVFLVVFCFLTDYLEPKLCGEMDDLTEAQKAAYKRFVVLDVIGYVGLVFFMISLCGDHKTEKRGKTDLLRKPGRLKRKIWRRK